MAIVKKGSILEGLRGRVGDLVFREIGGRTVVSQRPGQRREDPRSPERTRALTRFQQAVRFAREARHRPSYRSLARALRAHSPYHVALQDYLSEPVIEGIDDAAVGPSGGELAIRVSERVAVRSVRVKMFGRARPPGPAPETTASGAPPAPARPPIPAAVFFRHVARAEEPTGAPDRPAGRGVAGTPSGEILPSAGETGADRGLTPVELHATRRLGIRHKGEVEKGRSRRGPESEVWRVTLPCPGDVEIIAADYAGNRVTRSCRVGLPRTDVE